MYSFYIRKWISSPSGLPAEYQAIRRHRMLYRMNPRGHWSAWMGPRGREPLRSRFLDGTQGGNFRIRKTNIYMIWKLTRDMTVRISWAAASSSWCVSWGRAKSWDDRPERGKSNHMRGQACLTTPRKYAVTVPTLLPTAQLQGTFPSSTLLLMCSEGARMDLGQRLRIGSLGQGRLSSGLGAQPAWSAQWSLPRTKPFNTLVPIL